MRVATGLCAAVFFSVYPGIAADWPQWLGPERNGISSETGLLKNWPEAGPQEVWRAPLGKGFSGISISRGRVYTMFANGDGEFVICLKAENGEEVCRVYHYSQRHSLTAKNRIYCLGEPPAE